jgi:hypothetical protein
MKVCFRVFYSYNNLALQVNRTEAVREVTAEHPGHPCTSSGALAGSCDGHHLLLHLVIIFFGNNNSVKCYFIGHPWFRI